MASEKKDHPASVVSIKGFDHELKCRGVQFEVGKTYTVEGKIIACQNGFHAVSTDSPFHVWDFYPVVDDQGRLSRYAEVTQSGDMDSEKVESGTKIASASLTVNVELSLPDFIKRAVSWIVDATKGKDKSGGSARIGSSGYCAQIGSSGDYVRIGSSGGSAQIGSSGYSAQIGSSGDSARIGSSGGSAQIGSSGDSARIGSSGGSARIGSSGDYVRIGSSGDYVQIGSSGGSARIGSSGDYVRIGSSGDSARIGSSGYYARIGSSGDSARIGSSGYSAQIVAEGKKAVVACAGKDATVTGADGAWISIAEYNPDGDCTGFASGCIGKDGLKPGVPYIAKGGKLVEAE